MDKQSDSGFSLIELLIVVVIVGILAAIAIPNLISSRRTANESSALASLRTYHGAQITYQATKGDGNFAGDVGPALSGVALTQLDEADLIDEVLGSGVKSGYTFTGAVTLKSDTVTATVCGRTVPTIVSGVMSSGSRNFGLATDGVMMAGLASNPVTAGCALSPEGALVITNATATN